MENHTPKLRPGTIYPDPCKRQTSVFIARLLDKVGDTDLTAHPAFYMPSTGRKRVIRLAGRQSLNAVLRVLLANVDIATATVTASQRNLAKQPLAGGISNTRFSRALRELEIVGVINFSKDHGRRAVVLLTALGLSLFSVSLEEWRAAGGAMSGRDSLI
nr:MAG: IncFII RepA protein family [Bacteriophage sp.]